MKASLLKAQGVKAFNKTLTPARDGKVKWSNQNLEKINSVKVWVA